MAFLPTTRDFIDRTRAELAGLEKSLEPVEYRDLVCYFAGFFTSEDRRTDPEAGKCRKCGEPLVDDDSDFCAACENDIRSEPRESAGEASDGP